MNPSTVYFTSTNDINPAVKAHTLRIGRLELCSAWFKGPMPSRFYFLPNGRPHPGAVSLTFRAFRVMLGWRWYQANGRDEP